MAFWVQETSCRNGQVAAVPLQYAPWALSYPMYCLLSRPRAPLILLATGKL